MTRRFITTVIALQAKTRFGELLEHVAQGEEIVITRHDKPMARIVPEGRPKLQQVPDAVDELRKLRKKMAARPGSRPLTDKEIKDAITKLTPKLDEESSRHALGHLLDLAYEHGLSLYEATYLELCLRRGLPLASRDCELNSAARRCGVEVLL